MENQSGTSDRRLLDGLAGAQQRGTAGRYQEELRYGQSNLDGRSSPFAHQYGASGRRVRTHHDSCQLPRLRPKRGSVCAAAGILGFGIQQQPRDVHHFCPAGPFQGFAIGVGRRSVKSLGTQKTCYYPAGFSGDVGRFVFVLQPAAGLPLLHPPMDPATELLGKHRRAEIVPLRLVTLVSLKKH